MNTDTIRTQLTDNFPHQPTLSQFELIDKLAAFLTEQNQHSLFVITGYAGTGKTTVVRSLVKVLSKIKYQSCLLAPTGRAAKVLSNYSKKSAYTIHKKIYRVKTGIEGSASLVLMPNLHKQTIFIVDEASMISNYSGNNNHQLFQNNNILDDLVSFVYNQQNCKLILIGDAAQLPPVGITISPALDINYLKASYNFDIENSELTEVVRQKKESGILHNANKVRAIINLKNNKVPTFNVEDFDDVIKLEGSDLEDALNHSYSNYGKESTLIVCRSNRRANIYNQQIRNRVFYQENEISTGDLVMVVKNNYFWLSPDSNAGFIANGDTLEIQKIIRIEEIYGFRFAKAIVRLIDYPDEPELETILLLQTLAAESAALTASDQQLLYNTILQDYEHIPQLRLRIKNLKENPYFNALQVKFAYAQTCHKSQGGQWNCVFVEQGYLTQDMINNEYMRWLYTAITRATEKLYLVNFSKEFY